MTRETDVKCSASVRALLCNCLTTSPALPEWVSHNHHPERVSIKYILYYTFFFKSILVLVVLPSFSHPYPEQAEAEHADAREVCSSGSMHVELSRAKCSIRWAA